jgi:hypothetical protein
MTASLRALATWRVLVALLLVCSAAAILVLPHAHAAGADSDGCPACAAASRGAALPEPAPADLLSPPHPPAAACWALRTADPASGRDPGTSSSPRAPPATLPA